MFNNRRFLTRGVQAEIPFELQIFMWSCIDSLLSKRDYFQVFELKVSKGRQHIRHFSEQPEYEKEYLIHFRNPVNQKVYVIDDGDHSTMLLAGEY